MIPTLQTLASLCQVYGIGMGYFFADGKHHSLAITRKAHISEHGRAQLAAARTHLHIPTDRGRMVATILDLPPGIPSRMNATESRTELFAYVLDGRLQISIAGSHEVLETGDCALLDSEEPAVWSALGNPPAESSAS
jgi:uncharacterized cupin superfamily protein